MTYPVKISLIKLVVAATVSVGLVHASADAHVSDGREAVHDRAGSHSVGAPKSAKVVKKLKVTKDGAVVNARKVKGWIAVDADDVTIKNTTVRASGKYAIRILPGATGTKVKRTKVKCVGERTNGLVPGRYLAKRVAVNNCRRDFVSSDRHPATVIKSWIDGESYDNRNSVETPVVTPSPGRPGAHNTGVPAGTVLTPSDGMTITQDGTVIDGLLVRGTITIEADNVTIRNSLVQSSTSGYPILVDEGATGALIEDVEVDNMGGTGLGIFFSRGSGTVRRANVHSAEDGIRIEADDVTVEYSYVHDLQRQPDGHHDTIQIRRGDNITLSGNTLLPYDSSTGDPMNAALQIGSLLGDDQISNLRVIGNYMDGGNFTVNGGGRNEVDSALYSGNRFGRNFRYGVSGNLDNSVWDDTNVYDDTGEFAR
ncbi:hypothetical protein GCM10011376_28160 [Nocardioides flavus (ex Wang et al. 2016)]|uniref:Right handed beta helix domain-containing protein n=1 Tax=Nocardioides flavus (ex Wang et al. 2016) TaxID=2058780 RepID=A0ABQ3HKW8_9ACTN|nr:right-handed parallel beta-helix repeat-containing protein [Nocardioides flavus (ex Wang et al. 2016)]GHE18206.1 hypothetical protein GCM10011376_28160 [Nocardioides flavus (ex Wang et al. 2016)]